MKLRAQQRKGLQCVSMLDDFGKLGGIKFSNKERLRSCHDLLCLVANPGIFEQTFAYELIGMSFLYLF